MIDYTTFMLGGMNSLINILITGTNSYIGMSVEQYLAKWPNKYKVTTIDVKNFNASIWNWSNYDVVYHVAGVVHSNERHMSKKSKENYYIVNTDLTAKVAKKAKKDKVRQFIFMSSMSVYGEGAPIGRQRIIDLNTKATPTNFYGDSKLKGEERLNALRDENFKVCILRPPMIYGKGSKGNFSQLVRISKKLPIFPAVKNQRSMLYIINLCEFVRLMIDNCEEGVFFPQNKSYSCTSSIVCEMAKIQGKKMMMIRCEKGLKLLSYFTPLVNKAFGNMTYELSMSDYKENYQIVSTKKSIEKTIM